MAHAEADDLTAIFFGDHPQHSDTAPTGRLSRCGCEGNLCDICDIRDKQATARASGPKQGLRHAATSCDIGPAGAAAVANVAGCRKRPNGPESEQRRGLSQKSQMSLGVRSQPAAAPDPLALVAWTDADIASFTARLDRLTRWGWPAADAEAMAERLTQRDRSGDDRVNCTDCRHYRPGRCGNHRDARLNTPEIGRDLVTLLQRCPGFKA